MAGTWLQSSAQASDEPKTRRRRFKPGKHIISWIVNAFYLMHGQRQSITPFHALRRDEALPTFDHLLFGSSQVRGLRPPGSEPQATNDAGVTVKSVV